jgi:hypothetical protein
MTANLMGTPTAEGFKRYPPDGRYHTPEGYFTELASDPCTCCEHCENPCIGLSDCECQACSLRSVVEHGDSPAGLDE